ncbi:MAG: Lrp/AsnC family transcriptional regulator [Gammaproteobacteria bacterium]|nr:MAG: Lrp/AsnC family transcriptional regulator [Gammaproteobacteria bacterium]
MDDTDRQLIGLLRSDARATVASLAKALGVARGTVQNRMARLSSDGTIVGYTVRLKPDVEEQRMRALMTVAVEGNKVDAVIRALRGDPAVAALHSTNGRWDVVAELRADSLEGFDRVLARIRSALYGCGRAAARSGCRRRSRGRQARRGELHRLAGGAGVEISPRGPLPDLQ